MANTVSVGTRVTGVGKASSDLDRFRDKFDKLQKQGAKGFAIGVGAAAGVAALGALDTALSTTIDFMSDSVAAASNLEQSVGAIESVFGPASKTIEEFGKTSAKAFGLSKREVNELGAVMGAQLQSMGFSADEAAKRTVLLEKRAADLAATFGGPTSDAVQAISAVLRGERDPIERYGISIKQADVNARILAKGLDTSTTASKKNAEATAALEILYEQSAKSAGQFARETDSLAGAQARANAKLEDAQAALGAKLTPALASAADLAVDLIEDFEEIGKGAEDLASPLAAVNDFLGGIGHSAEDATGQMESLTGKGFSGMNDAEDRAKALRGAIGDIGTEAERAFERVHKSNQSIVDDFDDMKERLTTVGEQAADAIYDPIIAAGELAATEREISEQKQIIASKKSSKEQVQDAKTRLAELNKKRIGLIAELTAYGKTSKKEQVKFINELKEKYKTGTAEQRAAINLLIGQLKSLWTWQERVNDNAFDSSSHRRASTGGRRAGGGPVEAKTPYLVGEQGPELFMPSTDGQIIPAGPTAGIMGGGGGGAGGYGPLSLTVVVQDQTLTGMTPGQARAVGENIGPAIFEWGRRNRWVAAR